MMMSCASSAFKQLVCPVPTIPLQAVDSYSGSNTLYDTESLKKDKVVLVMGATGTGKSRLAIDLATRFGGEVVNCDKMQVYDGLDIVTNKVTEEERAGVPHHLLGGIPPDDEFTASDFRRAASAAVASIAGRGRLPIIAGGSNSYIEELVDGAGREFRRRYDCCFLWVDVQLSVLHGFVTERVDRMVERGLVEEVRGMFDRDVAADYSRGLRKAIGVPELDRYLRAETTGRLDEASRERLLAAAIDDIKANTCKLSCCQLDKIRRLCTLWDVRRIDATGVFQRKGKEADKEWEMAVTRPSIEMVEGFLAHQNIEEVGWALGLEAAAGVAGVICGTGGKDDNKKKSSGGAKSSSEKAVFAAAAAAAAVAVAVKVDGDVAKLQAANLAVVGAAV